MGELLLQWESTITRQFQNCVCPRSAAVSRIGCCRQRFQFAFHRPPHGIRSQPWIVDVEAVNSRGYCSLHSFQVHLMAEDGKVSNHCLAVAVECLNLFSSHSW